MDIRRIEFVTARFQELQGLGVAWFSAGLLGGALVQQSLSSAGGGGLYSFHALMVANLLWGACQVDLALRYRSTFGAAVGGTGMRDTTWVSGLPMFALMVGVVFDAASLPYRSGASVGALGLALASSFLVARDRLWRLHYLVPVAAGLTGAYITSGVWPARFGDLNAGDARAHAMIAAQALAGFGLLTAALFDHQLLLGAFAPRGIGHRDAALARAASGRARAAIAAIACACAAMTWAVHAAGAAAMNLDVVFNFGISMVFFATAMWQLKQRRRSPRRSGRPFTFDAADIAVVIGVALAATLDTVLGGAGVPYATVVASAAASGFVAVRDWPLRRHYTLGIAAAVIVLLLAPRMSTTGAVLLFLVAVSGALAIENLLDMRLARTSAVVEVQ